MKNFVDYLKTSFLHFLPTSHGGIGNLKFSVYNYSAGSYRSFNFLQA